MKSIKENVKAYVPECVLRVFRIARDRNAMRGVLRDKLGLRYIPSLRDFPPMVLVETTTRCNLACNHCPCSILSRDKQWIGDIEIDLYKKVIDEIAEESPQTIVRPFSGGEPFMRKDLEDLILYAKDKGIRHVSINTNGTLLTEKRIVGIVESGLDHIEFSVDAFSAETFLKLKNVDLYNKVVCNIEAFVSIRDQMRPELITSVSFVKQRANIHEAEDFLQYWSARVDRVHLREYHEHGRLVDGKGKYKETGKQRRYFCPYLWERLTVHRTGKVTFCENDWKADHAIGDARDQSLKEIWLSEAYQQLRKSHAEGTFNHAFCRDCPDWRVIG